MNKYMGFVILLSLANPIIPAAAPANLKSIQNLAAGNPPTAASAAPVQNAPSPADSVSLSAVSQGGVAAPAVDQKAFYEIIPVPNYAATMKALNIQRQAIPIVRKVAAKKYPLVPSFEIEEKLPLVYPAGFLKDFLPDNDSVELVPRGRYFLDIYTKCIPILNGMETTKKLMKESYTYLTQEDIDTQALVLQKTAIMEKITSIYYDTFGRLICDHSQCGRKPEICPYGYLFTEGVAAHYQWLIDSWEKTKKLNGENHQEILAKIAVLNCGSEK